MVALRGWEAGRPFQAVESSQHLRGVAREVRLLDDLKNLTPNKANHFRPHQHAVIIANFVLTLDERVRALDLLLVDRAL